MNDFFEHIGADLRELGQKIKDVVNKLLGKPTTSNGASVVVAAKTSYEINLVPSVKIQMIKAQKMRNLVLFICIVVSSVAVGAVIILFGIKSGQDIAMANQDSRLQRLSDTLNSYDELDSLITIQNQLAGIDEIDSQKTAVARVFGALGVMLPQGADSVQLSELNINLATNVIQMKGQADAKTDPLIDARVLESFKKSASLTKYDYGRYVDIEGNEIPSHCIKEANSEGEAYRTGENNYYAWWELSIPGCEASQRGGDLVDGAEYYYSSTAEVEMGIPDKDIEFEKVCDENDENCAWQMKTQEGDDSEEIVAEDVQYEESEIVPIRVKIWRTPQFNNWLDTGRMTLEGDISGVEHFVSECITYSGTRTSDRVRWTSTNDCMLIDPEQYTDGLDVTSFNNSRDDSSNLVLKFTARTTFAEEFFAFSNKHMIAIGPLGQNVTDSYVQIGNMFTEEAHECEPNDTECLNNSKNTGTTSGETTGGNTNG